MSKPGYTSVSLPNETEHELQQIGDDLKSKYPDIIKKSMSRVAIIQYLVNYYRRPEVQDGRTRTDILSDNDHNHSLLDS